MGGHVRLFADLRSLTTRRTCEGLKGIPGRTLTDLKGAAPSENRTPSSNDVPCHGYSDVGSSKWPCDDVEKQPADDGHSGYGESAPTAMERLPSARERRKKRGSLVLKT